MTRMSAKIVHSQAIRRQTVDHELADSALLARNRLWGRPSAAAGRRSKPEHHGCRTSGCCAPAPTARGRPRHGLQRRRVGPDDAAARWSLPGWAGTDARNAFGTASAARSMLHTCGRWSPPARDGRRARDDRGLQSEARLADPRPKPVKRPSRSAHGDALPVACAGRPASVTPLVSTAGRACSSAHRRTSSATRPEPGTAPARNRWARRKRHSQRRTTRTRTKSSRASPPRPVRATGLPLLAVVALGKAPETGQGGGLCPCRCARTDSCAGERSTTA